MKARLPQMSQPVDNGEEIALDISCVASNTVQDPHHPEGSMSDGLWIEGNFLQQAYTFPGDWQVRRERHRAGQTPQVQEFTTDGTLIINPSGGETRKDMLKIKFESDFEPPPKGWGGAPSGDLLKIKIWREL